MHLRSVLAASALACTVSGAASACAQIMSLNHVVTNGLPHDECMRRAAATILDIGFNSIGATTEAQWGRSPDQRFTVAIYCLKTRDVAMFAVDGPDRNITSETVSRLLSAWRTAP